MKDETVTNNPSLIDRVKAIILKPKETWPTIETDQKTQADILRNYVLPLAAIGPIATFLGAQIFGYGGFGFSYRPSLVSSLIAAIVSYVLTIAGVFLLTYIADFFAPKFGGVSNKLSAFKLVAYGATAAWVAGIFNLVPALSIFGLLGLYSIYLFYTGTTPLMKVPAERALSFTAITFLCAIVIFFIIGLIANAMVGPTTRDFMGKTESASGTFSLPGGGTIDLGEMERMGRQMENAAAGNAQSVSVADMRNLLPASLGSHERTALETASAGRMGSSAEATYAADGKSFTLRIVDMAGLGALAGLGTAMGVEQSREDASGYSRTGTVDGQMQTEEWNLERKRGKFARMIENRFMVEAEGEAESIDQLKAAVNAINTGQLRSLAE